MNENVFRRVEKKYIITREQKDEFLKLVNDYIDKDIYYESHISNIYFDNDNNDMISKSLEKPIFKAKVRLRSYEERTNLNSKVYLEIKDKYRGIVGKRRIKLLLSDFYKYLETGEISDSQIAKEIDYYFKMYNLKPFMYVAYDRLSYRGKSDDTLRITVDANLRSRETDLQLENKGNNKKYFNDDVYIMEIKLLDAMPLWLTEALSKLKIYPDSFSKVGSIYTKLNKERSEILC